ncbi:MULTISPECIES: response regulator [Halomonadaceae]|jgi:DNA-binding response OmpR family regulator|uniref:Chemotaxis protein CheY n=2 Tax=Halomonadaceae TaxID=28256 RepID=A0A246S403_9GAMM|nr:MULTISPECIES: response regulator [Halomonas]MCH4813602.1 response regulator [Halomonas neptunia]OWV31149.1 chemotaxis protein CheY [Halomonas campaniensis]
MDALERVLYVEDDPDIRDIAAMALEDVGGLTVKVCESGEQALSEAGNFAPQMFLLDVMMPGMDGPRTLLELKRKGHISDSIAVAFMTAKVHPEEVARYKEIGAIDVIAKPFDPMTLADDVRAIWKAFHA